MFRFLSVLALLGCGEAPFNGGFELWHRGTPDGWTKEADDDTTGIARGGELGGSWLRFPAGEPTGTAPLTSTAFAVESGTAHLMEWAERVAAPATGGRVGLALLWLDGERSIVGLDVAEVARWSDAESLSAWTPRRFSAAAPAAARFARVMIAGLTSGDLVLDVDSVRVDPL